LYATLHIYHVLHSNALFVFIKFTDHFTTSATPLWLLVDPVVLSTLPGDDIVALEPQSDLLLGALDTVGAVADVAANIDCIVAAYFAIAS
jgi:hypothetical protein